MNEIVSLSLSRSCCSEKDTNDELLWVWSFPSITPGLRKLITSKCTIPTGKSKEGEGGEGGEGGSNSGGGLSFSFGHVSSTWYYLANYSTGDAKTLPRVTSFCVVLLSTDFNPEKYQQLCGVLSAAYLTTGSPVSIVPHFLSVFTRGEIVDPPAFCQPFSVADHDIRKAYVACSFKGLVQQYGLESILIYTAILLKKRIVVYASSLESLLRTCRTIPLFVWHRQNWNVVYPQLSLDHKGEMDELTKHSTYVAGFLDPSVQGRTDLYDLLINVPEASLTVAPHAKDAFMMTKLHKDIAMLMLQCVQSDEHSDNSTIKEVSKKTKELINNVRGLAPPESGKITLELLHKRKMNPATENFLFSLASVEGLTEL